MSEMPKLLSPERPCRDCKGDMYHYAGCVLGEHGSRDAPAELAAERPPEPVWDPAESEEDAANLRHVSAIVDRVLKVAEGHDVKNGLAPWIATEILEEIGPRLRAGVAERRDPPAPSDGRVSVMLKMPYFMSDEDIAQLLQPYDVSELRVHDLAMYEGKYRTAACKLTVESLFALSREKRTHVVGCTANHAVALRAGGPAREEPSELLVAMTGMLAMFGGHDALDHDTDAAAKKCDKCRVLADARNAYGDAALSSGLGRSPVS